MKYLALTVFALVAGAAFADGKACCMAAEAKTTTAKAKAHAKPKHGEGCCEATVAAGHAGCEDGSGLCCAEKALDSSNADMREQAFWAMANAMKETSLLPAEKAAKELPACCAAKAGVIKVEDECGGNCCAKTGYAAFKVFAGGKYHFFGCEGSAGMGREALIKQGFVAGAVQPVVGKHLL